MDNWQKKTICAVVVGLFIVFITAGCVEPIAKKELAPEIDLGATIGSLVEISSPKPIPVESYALVGGLRGTGSPQCSLHVRKYLTQYILRQLPDETNAERFINSRDTAMVLVQGFIPAGGSRGQYFDVQVTTLPGSQATSLEGGELWGAELFQKGRFDIALNALATAEGPVYIDKISKIDPTKDKKTGYVLAGGTVLDDYRIRLVLRKLDFRTAGDIRNILNRRFEGEIARASSESVLEVRLPAGYASQRQRFISMIKATYMVQSPELTSERVKAFVRELIVSDDKEAAEIALESIGAESIDKLNTALNSSDEQVRLHAGRCMLNLGSNAGLETLRKIAMDTRSSNRIAALKAIGAAAPAREASAIARKLVRDVDFDVKFSAYEQLRRLEDVSISQKLVGRNFYLEQIAQDDEKIIFVSRSGQPRVVLFGSPIYCRDNTFVRSQDGSITINVPAGSRNASIIRKVPDVNPISVQSSLELDDIIQTLCEEPLGKGDRGLNVSYADMIAFLKQMTESGAVSADFRTGDLPKIGQNLKKKKLFGR